MFEFPPDLDPALIPMAFLLGTWEGEGLAEYPTMEPLAYRQRLVIEVLPGRPALRAVSETWRVDTGAASGWECAFWRPGDAVTEVELLVTHAAGMVEVLYGQVRGLSVELATDAVMSSATGPRAGASTRTYGRVGDDLAYAIFLATPDTPMTGHAGARLTRLD